MFQHPAKKRVFLTENNKRNVLSDVESILKQIDLVQVGDVGFLGNGFLFPFGILMVTYWYFIIIQNRENFPTFYSEGFLGPYFSPS